MKNRQKRKFILKTPIYLAIFGAIIAIITIIAAQGNSTSPVHANILPAYSDPRIALLATGTIHMTELPTVLPSGGVTINNQFVLRPLTAAQNSAVKITASQAIAIGRTYANAHPFTASALLTSFTSIISVPLPSATGNYHVIKNVSSWIVTFTTNNPQNVIQGKRGSPPDAPRHFNIALNASTGAFVQGFFTE